MDVGGVEDQLEEMLTPFNNDRPVLRYAIILPLVLQNIVDLV